MTGGKVWTLIKMKKQSSWYGWAQSNSSMAILGPVYTGRGAPCNTRMQIMGHTTVNGSVHTGCKQHQRVCTQICAQICFRVLCEWGRRTFKTCSTSNVVSEMLRKLDIWPQMLIHSRAPLHWGFDFDPCLVHVQNERSSCRANKRNLLYRWVPLNPNMLNLNSS